MLTKMRLENFKSWRELEIDLAPITLLYGTNSSGKTSILHALLLLKQTANSFDRGQHINFGGSERDYIDSGSYRDLVHNHEEELPVGLELAWQTMDLWRFDIYLPRRDDDTLIRYKINWVQNGDLVIVKELSYESTVENKIVDFLSLQKLGDNAYDLNSPSINSLSALSDKTSFETKVRLREEFNLSEKMLEAATVISKLWRKTWINRLLLASSSDIDFLVKERGISRRTINALKERLEYQKHTMAPESCYGIVSRTLYFTPSHYSYYFERLMGQIQYLGPLRDSPKRTYQWSGATPQAIEPTGKNTIEALVASKRGHSEDITLLEEVTNWLERLGLTSDFEIEAIDRDKRFYETRIKMYSEDVFHSLLDVGFGISQVLPVLTMLFFVPQNSIVLIEQPELHLHPSAQAKLADLFLEVAEKRHLQLIIESHSEHLLRRMQRRIAEVDHPFATPENIKAYFCEAGADGSKIQPVEVDEYGQIHNWPPNFFGDLAGDLDAMMEAAIQRRRQELSSGD